MRTFTICLLCLVGLLITGCPEISTTDTPAVDVPEIDKPVSNEDDSSTSFEESIGLKELLDEVRKDLRGAEEDAANENEAAEDDLLIEIEKVELQLRVDTRKSATVKGGLQVYVASAEGTVGGEWDKGQLVTITIARDWARSAKNQQEVSETDTPEGTLGLRRLLTKVRGDLRDARKEGPLGLVVQKIELKLRLDVKKSAEVKGGLQVYVASAEGTVGGEWDKGQLVTITLKAHVPVGDAPVEVPSDVP